MKKYTCCVPRLQCFKSGLCTTASKIKCLIRPRIKMKFWSRSYENVLTMRYLIRQITEFLSTAFGGVVPCVPALSRREMRRCLCLRCTGIPLQFVAPLPCHPCMHPPHTSLTTAMIFLRVIPNLAPRRRTLTSISSWERSWRTSVGRPTPVSAQCVSYKFLSSLMPTWYPMGYWILLQSVHQLIWGNATVNTELLC